MKIPLKDSQKTCGLASRHPKSLKKTKGVKRSPEKSCKSPKAITSLEVMATEREMASSDLLPNDTISGLKTQQLEKRKQEGNDWKALKKVDYQRLETVLEEVQSSSETTSRYKRQNYEAGPTPSEVGLVRTKKPWLYNLVSITEHPESPSGDEQESDEEKKTIEKQEPVPKKQLNGERGDKVEITESQGEPAESISKELNGKYPQSKRSIILNGMMEVLPIFSNDKFVCSRDAISIEECEELETLDRALPMSGKIQNYSRALDDKPGPVSIRKGFSNRVAEKLGDFKEMTERKFRCKLLTDKNVIEQSSSHFINFLLVLTPFAAERERLIAEKKLRTDCSRDEAVTGESVLDEGQSITMFKVVYGMLLTVFGLISVILGVAWRSYEPPCILDYILQIIPFLHHRRTFFQLFFDRLFKIMSTIFDGLCKKNYLFLNGKTFDGNILN